MANSGSEFFNLPDWKEQLSEVVAQFRAKSHSAENGRFETDDEYHERITHELTRSKDILEENLNKVINTLCWPGGGVNEKVVQIASDIGYQYFTLPSKWRTVPRTGLYSSMIPRVGSFSKIRLRGKTLGYPGKREFRWYLMANEGSILHRMLLWFNQLYRYSFRSRSG
jgi:peptidoglycan/xylan/chitin deacetylase (PgdA/CDA1 family)